MKLGISIPALILSAVAAAAPSSAQQVKPHVPGLIGGSDTTPPGKAVLTITSVDSTSVLISWIAPGDDNGTGTAASYDLRYRVDGAFDGSQWNDPGTVQVTGEPTPSAAGTLQTFIVVLPASTTACFILKTLDDAGNFSLSDPVTGSVDMIAPGKVLGFQPVGMTSSSLDLAWVASGDDDYSGTADHYTLHWSMKSFLPGDEAGLIADPETQHQNLPATPTSLSLGGLVDGSSYVLTITCSDENFHTGAPADMILAKTPAYVPGAASASAAGSCSASGIPGGAVLILLAGLALRGRTRTS